MVWLAFRHRRMGWARHPAHSDEWFKHRNAATCRVHRDDERDSWWEHPSVNLTWGPSSDHAGKIIGCMSALDAERWLAAQGMVDRL